MKQSLFQTLFFFMLSLVFFAASSFAGGGDYPDIIPRQDATPGNCQGLEVGELRHAFNKFVDSEPSAEGTVLFYPVYYVEEKVVHDQVPVQECRTQTVTVPEQRLVPIVRNVPVGQCFTGRYDYCGRPIFQTFCEPRVVGHQWVTEYRTYEQQVPQQGHRPVSRKTRVCKVKRNLREVELFEQFTVGQVLAVLKETPYKDLEEDFDIVDRPTPEELYPLQGAAKHAPHRQGNDYRETAPRRSQPRFGNFR